ncbi:MAG TPA: hypothetical protein VHG28_15180 [Longimicrobiaceae bacterium]|nr:hypothetical protein [Longimicrobiaceae bacterium]
MAGPRGLRGAVVREPIVLRWRKAAWRKDPAPRERTATRERGYRQSLKAEEERHRRDHGFLGELTPLRVESFEDRETRLHAQHVSASRRRRDDHADSWRRARRRLRELPRDLQRAIAEEWNASWVPADPVYLLTFLDRRAPTPERVAELRAAREHTADAIRRARTKHGTPWMEHAGCGGVLQEWHGGPRNHTCLRCQRTFTHAAAALREGEIVIVDPRTALQEGLPL